MHVEKKDVLATKSMHLTKCNAILKSPLNRAALKTTSTRALRLTFYSHRLNDKEPPSAPVPGVCQGHCPLDKVQANPAVTPWLRGLQIPKPLSQVTRWDKDRLTQEAGTGMPRVQNNSRPSPCPRSRTRPGESGGTT